jgi:hypothetical protein
MPVTSHLLDKIDVFLLSHLSCKSSTDHTLEEENKIKNDTEFIFALDRPTIGTSLLPRRPG